ncbi:helix-turn-helix transcriptional regulator [Streptomyces sp. NPDC057539]|uniref:helix-turn-helix transcriptional regulator n=1 Tax=Streptomyces sp. NPDC057539 TaxID=3346159 RepID=UPI0036A17A67
MDHRTEIRRFLTSRRGKITPQQAGLPSYGGNRRVPGLRREEVASLAGVSVEYYARLERGNLSGVSESVLDSLVRALQLDEAERAHLLDLARTANTTSRKHPRRPPRPIRPALQNLLDAMTEAPAFIRNGRLDILATNRLGRALYRPVLRSSVQPANLARFGFLDPAAADFLPDLESMSAATVALLHTEAGLDPYNRDLTALIGELSTRSEEFRALWAAHDVQLHRSGTKRFRHPAVGSLSLGFESLPVSTDPGLTLVAMSAEPGTVSHDGLKLLASWAASTNQDGDHPRSVPHTEDWAS